MSKNKRIDSIPQVSSTSVHIEKIPGINTERLDPRISLKRWGEGGLGGSSGFGGIRKFVLDVYQLGGTKPTNIYQPIRGGNVGDVYVLYPSINLLGIGEMRANITKISNVGDLPISVKKGDVISVKGRINSANGSFKLVLGGSFRYLFGYSTGITRSNPQTDLVAISDGTLDIQYGDDGTNNFISAITITIN